MIILLKSIVLQLNPISITTNDEDEMTMCVCGSMLPEKDCCLKYINGLEEAPTALALMRSRYTAFAKGKVDYLYNTYVQEWQKDHPYEQFQNSFQQVTWKELKLLAFNMVVFKRRLVKLSSLHIISSVVLSSLYMNVPLFEESPGHGGMSVVFLSNLTV